eukprot:TRINITY_DN46348_c0_g2_i3.p7 TRINITY_DN46348_c0_g2~~TRINITY_DN46348_c0_g2_i3.p7  ORF type:complete len:103 (-),score=1.91 TRINITY_DN46348_c0_g2_i3:136-444(-)
MLSHFLYQPKKRSQKQKVIDMDKQSSTSSLSDEKYEEKQTQKTHKKLTILLLLATHLSLSLSKRSYIKQNEQKITKARELHADLNYQSSKLRKHLPTKSYKL